MTGGRVGVGGWVRSRLHVDERSAPRGSVVVSDGRAAPESESEEEEGVADGEGASCVALDVVEEGVEAEGGGEGGFGRVGGGGCAVQRQGDVVVPRGEAPPLALDVGGRDHLDEVVPTEGDDPAALAPRAVRRHGGACGGIDARGDARRPREVVVVWRGQI